MFEQLIGISTGWRKIEYNWRDMALYALGVGADENDLMYTWERNMKAIPSYGVVPYFCAVNNEPQQPTPYPGSIYARDRMSQEFGRELIESYHLGHELFMYRPIDPIKGSLVFEDRVSRIFDRGRGKGAVVESEVPVYDEAGNLLCLNRSTTGIVGKGFDDFGGFGGTPFPRTVVEYPGRAPDYTYDAYVSKTQNLLYRLSGDTNLAHVDIETARSFGQPRVYMQGLCSFGYACRMLCNAIIPGEPERMTHMSVQMRAVLFPDTHLQVRAWKIGENKVSFVLQDLETDRAILKNCIFEWK